MQYQNKTKGCDSLYQVQSNNIKFMNVFQYAAAEQATFSEIMMENSGYETFTTFYSDLSIAEAVSSVNGINDTYNRVCKEWITNYKYFTEFCMALNIKAWEYAPNARNNEELCALYSDLYYKARDLAYDNFDDEGKQYFFDMTD